MSWLLDSHMCSAGKICRESPYGQILVDADHIQTILMLINPIDFSKMFGVVPDRDMGKRLVNRMRFNGGYRLLLLKQGGQMDGKKFSHLASEHYRLVVGEVGDICGGFLVFLKFFQQNFGIDDLYLCLEMTENFKSNER